MDITIGERAVGQVTVLDIVGRLTIDHGAEHLRDKVNSLLAQERTAILLNLQGVPYMTAVASASWWRPSVRS
jgi:anti-anti-sigma regulatory factor